VIELNTPTAPFLTEGIAMGLVCGSRVGTSKLVEPKNRTANIREQLATDS